MIKKFDTFVNETFGMDLPKGSDPIIEKDSDNAMAKSQLTRTKDFVDMLIPIIDGMDDMEPWVQAKITKAEDYLNAVLNYYKGNDGITEESVNEAKEPKSWDSMFTMKAIEAYNKGEFDLDDDKSIAEWDKEYNGGRAPKPAFNTKEVVSYAIKTGKKPNGDKMDESAVTEAKRSVVHKAAKKGSYPVSIVVIRDGKVIAQELVKTPAEVPAAFNVIQSYHKHKGATVHIESKTGERLFSESLDEAVLDEFLLEGFDIEKLHFEMDPKKAEKLKIELGKSHGEIGKRNQIESGNYSLRKFRQTIGYWNGNKRDQDFAEGVFAGPEHYNTVRSTLGAGPHKKKIKKVKWNSKEYDKWLKTMATDNDGVGQDSSYGFEMAQNAEFEPGLIDWVKKSFRGEDPLQRIQWDIEGMMESVNFVVNEAEKYITNKFKVGDKIKTDFGEWEVIETDYKPGKSFMAPFIFKGDDMERVNIPNPPKTNKKAVGYKVTDGDKYPIIGFLYQYKGKQIGADITKLATIGIDESLINEAKMSKEKIEGMIWSLENEKDSWHPSSDSKKKKMLDKLKKDLSKFESVVTEAKNTIGLAFKDEDDYTGFVEFIKDEKGSIKKDFGWDSKTKSWEVIMDVKVLDKIYGEGTPGNKESGWYGALPGDFESVIIESINEGKVTKKSISKASDDLAKIIIELKDNLGKLQKSKTDEERAKYIEIAKDLTIKRKDASESLNLAIAKLDKNAELDLSGMD
jgi:hypothetical protein